MKNIVYPLKLKFKIGTLANDFVIIDANNFTVGYVRQKMFKFVDEIQVFSDSTKKNIFYTIKANKWIDFSAAYIFTDENGEQIGRVARKGWASVWNARYNIYDKEGNQLFYIKERNPWVKVCDAILNSIPIISLFAGYLFNPKYDVKDMQDNNIVMLKKDPSFWGRNFSVSKEGDLKDEHEEKIVLSLMMMILLERRRGQDKMSIKQSAILIIRFRQLFFECIGNGILFPKIEDKLVENEVAKLQNSKN